MINEAITRVAQMARLRRVARGGLTYHVINRANGKRPLFEHASDYASFEEVLAEARQRTPVRVLAYCIMPDHWHLVLAPRADGQLSSFMRWLTLTHAQRWHARHRSIGSGHIYRGRYRSFIVQSGHPLHAVCRYVERNPVRARLARRPDGWRWSSLRLRRAPAPAATGLLDDVGLPAAQEWLGYVVRPEPARELEALRYSVNRGLPFGEPGWCARMVERFDLTATTRPRGRPRRRPAPA